ncbi:MAG TPA: sulfite exporter TauE/SafE family protein [Gaiellaceae bacterium]|nr:sulfite exporter TauE/SafE family protein [Gaiellaceae bacterium]
MDVVLAIALGLVAGLLAGLFGVGGGILFVPTLTLALGLEQHHAQATSLLAILPTAAVGVWRQYRYGNLLWRPSLVLGLAGIGGVAAGGFLAESLPGQALRRLFGALLLATAAQIVWRVVRER